MLLKSSVKFKKAFLDSLPRLFEGFLIVLQKSGGISLEEDVRKFEEILLEFQKFYPNVFEDNLEYQ